MKIAHIIDVSYFFMCKRVNLTGAMDYRPLTIN